MFQFSIFKKNFDGFTLIEALALLFIFSVVAMAFFETYAVGTRMILESKRRLGATALANQKMEIVRSLDYSNVGTITGVPTGDIPEYENVSVNGMQYTVHTFVQYADDVFDRKAGDNPNDAIPNDYKRVRIKVYWGDEGSDQTVYVFANISPNGVETSAGGGVLSINILDSTGMGVSGATVHIENDDTGTDITTDTDATGNITLPGTPEGTQNYELTVSKSESGYYSVVTYPPAPPNAFVPMDEHASVVDDAVNQKSIVMDQYADIMIRSKDPFGTDILNFDFHMKGGKVLGTDSITLETLYGYDEDLITSASGAKDVQDQSYGQYTLSETDARYQLYKLNPGGATNDIFDALPGQTNTVDMILLDTQIGSVKIIVTNATDDSPIAGATAHLTNSTLGYDATVATDQYGFAYFPAALPELTAGTYDLEVSAAGFTSDNSTADVNGGLVTKAIELNP